MAYDDIVDAAALTQDGVLHVIALSTTGGSIETGEDGAETYAYANTVWAKIDLSAYVPGTPYEIPVEIVKTGGDAGWTPYIGVFGVNDASFDPATPDWTKLTYLGGANDIGDGTAGPLTGTFSLLGGTGQSPASDGSQSGVFYLALQDWGVDYPTVYDGDADFTYTIPAEPTCVQAEDVINADSPTASVVSGRVRETFNEWWDVGYVPDNQRDAALRWAWAGPAGAFTVAATGRFVTTSGSLGGGNVRILVAVNGRPFISVSNAGNTFSWDTDFTWEQYDGLDGPGDTYDEDGDQAPWVVIQPGDTVEVFVISGKMNNSFAWVPLDLERVCFSPVAVTTTYCTPSFQFPADPLGDVWGSPNGWGGQELVPDEIWTIEGITPYDEGNFPWGVNQIDYDMVALDDGTVYVINRDSTNDGGTDKHFVVVKKYDPGTDQWSQVDTLNTNDPDDGHRAEAVSCEFDGTYVYFVWWEAESPGQPSGANKVQFLWHCKRLDPADDSITELGTGQNVNTVVTQIQNYPGSNLACGIACEGDGGDVYVSTIETEDDGVYDNRLYVWRWNGSAWADTSLPDPSVTAAGWEINGENSFYDVLGPMVAARQAGPVTDGVTLVYSYRYGTFDAALCTIEYEVGVGWGNEILTRLETDVETNARQYGGSSPLYVTGTSMSVLWSDQEGRLLLVVDMLPPTGDGIWDVLQMNDGGTQWEVLNAVGPGDMTGQWRQSFNTAAIGPDGEVYRAMMMSTSGLSDFEPKIAKTCAGYGPGFALATTAALGEANDPTWYPFMLATAHYRLRIVGQDAYVITNLYVEDYDHDTGATTNVADGIFVFKLAYDPCDMFVPQIYRLTRYS